VLVLNSLLVVMARNLSFTLRILDLNAQTVIVPKFKSVVRLIGATRSSRMVPDRQYLSNPFSSRSSALSRLNTLMWLALPPAYDLQVFEIFYEASIVIL
jgi:hypothetical protein